MERAETTSTRAHRDLRPPSAASRVHSPVEQQLGPEMRRRELSVPLAALERRQKVQTARVRARDGPCAAAPPAPSAQFGGDRHRRVAAAAHGEQRLAVGPGREVVRPGLRRVVRRLATNALERRAARGPRNEPLARRRIRPRPRPREEVDLAVCLNNGKKTVRRDARKPSNDLHRHDETARRRVVVSAAGRAQAARRTR